MAKRILVIDDEVDLLDVLKRFFEKNDYDVLTASSGAEALERIGDNPDIILLDINLPDTDGVTLCSKMRELISCPILFLTSRNSDSDKIMGLQSGGDDYIVKPFSIMELGARVEAHLRRESRAKYQMEVRMDEDFVINYSLKEVRFKGEIIPLQKKEYEIVEFLSRHPGQLMSREQIYNSLWAYDSDSDPAVVMAHICAIRAKFRNAGCKPYIQTAWGSGYKWER